MFGCNNYTNSKIILYFNYILTILTTALILRIVLTGLLMMDRGTVRNM